jgi:putative thioredoxin
VEFLERTMVGELNQLGGQANGEAVKDVTMASFRTDVIAESAKRPVLVDFWAPWCGPCKQLAPLLEKVVKATAGKVALVKMNIDDHPQIAGQLGIQSIPAVIAFQKGQPVDGFMGALPESQIKGFLERLIGPLESEAVDLIAGAEEALAAGDGETAADLFSEALQVDPADPKALGGVVRTLVLLGDLEQARQVLDNVPKESATHAAIVAARAALEVAEQASAVGDTRELEQRLERDPNDHQARFDLALALNGGGRRDEAAAALLDIIKRDRSWNDDGARKQLVQFFEAWGPVDPATLSARRKLSGLLFS